MVSSGNNTLFLTYLQISLLMAMVSERENSISLRMKQELGGQGDENSILYPLTISNIEGSSVNSFHTSKQFEILTAIKF